MRMTPEQEQAWVENQVAAMSDLSARGAANPQTIREHLSGHSIVSRVLSGQRPYDGNSHFGSYRIECACGWSRDGLTEYGSASAFTEHLQANAVAALDLLDNAANVPSWEWPSPGVAILLIPDRCDTSLPDPAPRGDAE